MNPFLYQKNIKGLARQDFLAAGIVEKAEMRVPSTFFSREGEWPTAVLHTESGEQILLNSRYDPWKEARLLVDGFQVSESVNLIVLGFGLGYHILELLRRSGERDFILICEAYPYVIQQAFYYFDFSELFRKEVLWHLDESPAKIEMLLRPHTIPLLANGLSLVRHPPSEHLAVTYYREVKKAVNQFFLYAKVNINTQIEKASNFVGNAFENLEEYVYARPVKNLFDVAKGLPIFVVAAGPSLDKNVTSLREVVKYGYIVAVDSAVKTLLSYDVRPDFIVSIDFTEHALKYFSGIDTTQLALVFDSEIYPGILKLFRGRKYAIHLPQKSVSDFVTRIIGDKGGISKGLSVSHVAVLLAQKMGASEIVLVGQDLAYPRRQWHTKGSSFFQNLQITSDEELSLCEVEDIFGRRLKSATSLVVFKNHLEGMVKELSINCYDATEGGARIQGTKVVSLDEAIIRFCFCRKNVRTVLGDDGQAKEKEALEMLILTCHEVLLKLEKLNHEATSLARLLQETLYHFKEMGERSSVLNAFRVVREKSCMLDQEKALLELLKDSATEALLIRSKKTRAQILLLDKASNDDIQSLIHKEILFFNVIVRATHSVAEEIRAFLDRAKHKEKDGSKG